MVIPKIIINLNNIVIILIMTNMLMLMIFPMKMIIITTNKLQKIELKPFK